MALWRKIETRKARVRCFVCARSDRIRFPDAAASDSEQAASAQPETPAASAKPEAAQASVSADENLADTLSDGDGAAAQADATLSSSAKVYIQDAKDKDNSYSTKSGSLSAGDTLWANVYDEEDWEEYLRSNPGTWTYAWMAGTKNSASISDYTELVGQSQSLPSRPKWPANTSSAR